MNRRAVLLTFALLALAGFCAWRLRENWREEKSHEREVLFRAVERKKLLPPAPIDPPQPVVAAQYSDVAQHTLFSKDRNPTEIVEVKPPPPKPPLPPLPSYYGQARLGDPVIFLSAAGEPQKTYRAGDKVGGKDKFVIVGFDEEKITLNFNDETVEKKLDELRPKEAPAAKAAGPRPAQAQQPASSSASLSSNSLSLEPGAEKKDEIIGAPYGGGFFACVAGDNSPDGTVKDGKRKVISHTLFGQNCHWETIR
jgi:hypothetical protein